MSACAPGRALGLNARITRRDFLDGALLSLGALSLTASAGDAEAGTAYPPALAGLRGQTAESFRVLHALRDHDLSKVTSGAAEATGEAYDLVVVGGGIS